MNKKFTIIVASALMVCSTGANAQFGNILNKVENAAGKVKQAKQKVDNTSRKVNDASATVNRVSGGKINAGSVPGSSVMGGGSDIGFDDNSITFVKSKGGAKSGTFGVNDNIYAVVKLPKTISQIIKETGESAGDYFEMPASLQYEIRRSGMQPAVSGEYFNVRIPRSDFDKKELILDILPDTSDASSSYGRGGRLSVPADALAWFGAAENRTPGLDYGTQPFHFTFGPNNLYHGKFSFTVNNVAERKNLEKRIAGVQQAGVDKIAKSTTLPAEFNSKGKFSDPELSTANLKNLLQTNGFTLLKMGIESGPDYTVVKNDLDVPVYKITKAIYTAYRDPEGKCWLYKERFRREYEGGGRYGDLDIAATTSDRTPIACENIK